MNLNTALYRDPKNGKIAGVCAGLAEYFKLETWVVRILTVTAFFLLAGPFVLVAYIAAWFILEKKPASHVYGQTHQTYENDAVFNAHNRAQQSTGKGWTNRSANHEERKVEVKKGVYQAGEPPRQAFFDIQKQFRNAESRLRNIERYVTSTEFQVNRDISRL